MLHRMSSQEITEWQAYEERTGPLGAERLDVLAALISFYVVSALSDKKSSRKLSLSKLLPKWRKEEQSLEDMKAIAKGFTKQLGGEIH